MPSAAHVPAAAAFWLVPVSVGFALASCLALLAHLAWVVRRHARGSDGGAPIELERLQDCSVSARTRAGRLQTYQIAGSSFVPALLTVPNLRSRSSPWLRHVWIAADSLDPNSFRRPRVWQRWRDALREGARSWSGFSRR